LGLRIDLMTAETVAAPRIDAVAVAYDQREALRQGERQVGADASEAASGQAMMPEVIDPRVVGQELEVNPIWRATRTNGRRPSIFGPRK
jgi:hypothetical protein